MSLEDLPDFNRLVRVVRKLIKSSEHVTEVYGSGLLSNKLIVGSYESMTIVQLEELRYIMNQIIKKKKLLKRLKHGQV